MKNKGFSIFEIIVALVILSFAITGILVLYNASKRFLLHGRSTFSGTELDRNFLESLQATQVRQDTWGANCISTNGVDINCDTTPQTINGITYTPSYKKTAVGIGDLRRVELTFSWTEPD